MKLLSLECVNVGLESEFTSSVSYKKNRFLLELTLNFQISFVLHLDEAVNISNNLLPQSVWMKQLPPYAIGCKTQIALTFKNIFTAASLSCYLIDSKTSVITK